MKKPQNVYMPIDRFVANVFRRESGPERSAWVTAFALTLADTGDDDFANELKQNALDDMATNRQRQERFRERKQRQITSVRVSGSGDAPAPVTSGQNARPAEASTGPGGDLYTPGGVPDGDAGDASARTTAPGQALTTTRTRAGESADKGASSLAPANGGSARGGRLPDAPGATEGFLIPSAPDPAPARSRKDLPALGEFRNVRISEGEMAALVAEFGDVSAIVEELSSYKAATGKNYKNDFAALRNWLLRRKAEGKRPDGRKQTQGERMAEYFARREIEIEMLDRERAGNRPAEYGVTDDEFD